MRKFACAAVMAAARSAPVLAGALMDHSAVSVLGAPGTGPCSSECFVGGTDGGTPGRGGHYASPQELDGSTLTGSGTIAVQGGQTAGRVAAIDSMGHIVTAVSGNASKPGTGHCTGPTC